MFIPEVLVMQDPAGNVAQGLWRQLERVVTAAADAAYEPGAFEDANVFAEAGEGHWIWFGEIGYTCGASGEAFEDGAPRGIGDRVQDAVDVLGTLNHTVKLQRDRLHCQPNGSVYRARTKAARGGSRDPHGES